MGKGYAFGRAVPAASLSSSYPCCGSRPRARAFSSQGARLDAGIRCTCGPGARRRQAIRAEAVFRWAQQRIAGGADPERLAPAAGQATSGAPLTHPSWWPAFQTNAARLSGEGAAAAPRQGHRDASAELKRGATACGRGRPSHSGWSALSLHADDCQVGASQATSSGVAALTPAAGGCGIGPGLSPRDGSPTQSGSGLRLVARAVTTSYFRFFFFVRLGWQCVALGSPVFSIRFIRYFRHRGGGACG